MAQPGGFEPPTVRLEGGCSIQLSYGCTWIDLEGTQIYINDMSRIPEKRASCFINDSVYLCKKYGAN